MIYSIQQPKYGPLKKTLDKLNFIKIKNIYSSKDNVRKMKREKIFANHIYRKRTSISQLENG